ncbi:MAG: arginine--tRNA ligase [Candidatus Kaiserbacteria bacterium]|nr:arginine--tRNA ligase [Candidatus Kaiserbacteria bacterium]
MEERIRKAVADAIGESATITVKRPSNTTHGDYAVFVGMEMAEKVSKNIKEELGDAVDKVEIAEPGFVNITLSQEAITFAIAEAAAQGAKWGKGSAHEGECVVIEYTDPNPFKEMHIGHLMSNVIGESLARLIENEGAAVIRVNYQGDVGPHVAKALWGLQKKGIKEPETAKEIGTAYTEGSRAYEESPEAKNEIDALNQAIYKGGNPALMELWRKGRDISLEAFERLYEMLGTHFDYYFFESETAEPGLRIVRDGIKKGIFEESEGAVIYRGEKKGLHTLVFITSAGTPTYEAKDIGLAFLKEERVQSGRSLIITANEQIGHFKVMLSALNEIAPLIAKKTEHIPHGFLKLASGKMSSRLGNVITAEGLIESIIKKASEKNSDPLIAEQVALGAIKYMILRQAPGSDIIFDEERSLSLEGDSGPYLQYALVRAKKILAYGDNGVGGTEMPDVPYAVERIILHFPEVVARAIQFLAPNLLTTYLTELAAAWNSFYATEQILGSPEEAYKQRVARAFANTMINGLALLGIPAPERM